MTVHIDQATSHDVEPCARLIAAAFLDDPVLRVFVRGDRNRLARLTALHVATLIGGPQHGGAIDVVRSESSGEVIAVGVWEGPTDTTPWGVRLRVGWHLVRAIGLRHAVPSVRALRAFEAVRPRMPHWYLADIAVSPTAQGRGLGSALLRHRLDAIDGTERLPAFLEATTEGSRRLYERWGFEATGTIEVDGTVATAMIRPAATPPGTPSTVPPATPPAT